VLHKNAKLELLKRVPLFAGLSKRDLALVGSIADELDLPAGAALTKEGARGAEFVVIVDGAADVRRGTRKVNSLGAGDFLGEISLITGRPRTATVTTTEPTRILVLTSAAFKRLLRDTPSLQQRVLETLAERVEH
jgi:CRP-like cAMP-binding protein